MAISTISGADTIVSAAATDYSSATSFDVNVYKLGRMAVCSYFMQMSQQVNAGTAVLKLPYKPAFQAMVNLTDITRGLVKAVNMTATGELVPYNNLIADDWLEGSFVYFTEE